MKNKLKYFLVFFLFLGSSLLYSQNEQTKNEIIEQRVDFLLESNEGGTNDYTSLFDQLDYFFEHPLNINHVDESQLLDLGLMNGLQINNLLLHIKQNGKLIAVEELQSIDGFDIDDILMLRPFVQVKKDLDQPNINLKRILKEGSSELFIRHTRILEEQEGFSEISEADLLDNENARYLGSPDKLFTRYRFNYANNLSFGFTGEKDAGEQFFKGKQKNGFDFYSAHLFLQNFGKVKQVAIGDFQAQFGQGLTFWSGLAFGRTPNIFTLKRNAPGLRRYSSVQEDLFLRGGGISIDLKPITITFFHSSQKVDANISGLDSISNEVIVSSLLEGGFHRTKGELENKNSILNQYTGGNIQYKKDNFQIGLTGVHNQLGGKFNPSQRIYNQFSQLDESNSNIGMDYNYLMRNINFFGEFAKSIDGGIAYTNGLIAVLDPRLSVAIQHRRFDRNYIPIQSNAIGENSLNTNENSTFIGVNFKISKQFNLSSFVDRYHFNWLRFQTDAPSKGQRYLVQLDYKPRKSVEVYFRYRQRARDRNTSLEQIGLNSLEQEKLNNYRFHFSYKASKEIRLKSRIEVSNYSLDKQETSSGFLMYQDISYKKLSSPLSFSARFAIFESDSYDSRIYAYENDVLYAFSIPAYSGRGTRFYLLCKYHITRGVDLWLRYAQTSYADRNEIGSGKDAISGHLKSEIKTQLRIKF